MRRATILNLLLLAGFLALLSFTKLPRVFHELVGILIAAGITAHLIYAKGWLRVSRICLGCMGFGDAGSGQHSWTVDEAASHRRSRRGGGLHAQ